MKNRYIFLAFFIIVLGLSCNSSEQASTNTNETAKYALLQKAKWILGSWKNISADGIATESWQKLNDSTFTGNSIFVIKSDTVSSEKLALTQEGNSLFYIPTVSNQNNNQPVKFTLGNSNDTLLVFENPQHDFPTKITYTKITNDSIVAEISGMSKGKAAEQQFPMKRVK